MKTLTQRKHIYDTVLDMLKRYKSYGDITGICYCLWQVERGLGIEELPELWDNRPERNHFGADICSAANALDMYWWSMMDIDVRIAFVQSALDSVILQEDCLEEHEEEKRLRYMDIKNECITDLSGKTGFVTFIPQ